MDPITSNQDQTIEPIAKAKDMPHTAAPESEHEIQTKAAVIQDRANYEHPENPRQKYGHNINDQAYSQSSSQDYIRTHSTFYHAENPDSTLNRDL